MRKQIYICIAATSLFGVVAGAAIRDEWIFKDDAPQTTLHDAINSGLDGSVFEVGGAGILETDGQGVLQSTPPGIGGFWGGIKLDADIQDQNSLYLRYDLEYDFSSPFYDNGSMFGISFVDGAGEQLAGLMFALEVDYPNTAPAGKTLRYVATEFEKSGTLSAIARISNNTITVWYKIGLADEFVEAEPAEQVTVPLSTISGLRVRASGDAFPVGSGDYVAVENIRTADTWEEITTVIDIGRVLSEDEIIIHVAPGETNSASVEIFNTTLDAVSFNVEDNGLRPVNYVYQTESALRYPFGPAQLDAETVFEWQNGQSVPMDIGFGFTLFGHAYQQFSVDQFGTLTLLSADNLEAVVVPFESSSPIDTPTLRYHKAPDHLIVAWGNGLGTEFQVRLNANGTIQYFYEIGTWDGWIGLIDEQGRRYSFDHAPGQTLTDSLRIIPSSWVTYLPTDGNVEGAEAETLKFTASPPLTQNSGTYQFTASVRWGGQVDEIDVTVVVEPKIFRLDVPADFAFTGSAGSISLGAVMTVTNSGNVKLTYTLLNGGLRNAGYVRAETVDQWVQVPDIPQYELKSSQLDSEPISIGFPFVFFGHNVTELTVETDGALTFSNGESIVPFSAGQQMGVNSSVRAFTSSDATRFVVTWDYLLLPDGTDDQRFQAVLHRDGRIQFNYFRMTEGWQDGVIELNGPFAISGSLVNDETAGMVTNELYETVFMTNLVSGVPFVDEDEVLVGTKIITNYWSTITGQEIGFDPGLPNLISYSPASATLSAGAIANVILKGDARTLEKAVTVDTTLIFNYSDKNSSSDVEFTTTDAAIAAAAEVQVAMWGAENPVVSGTMNADGSRALFWPAPSDKLNRVYTIWYTLSLTDSWTLLDTVKNRTTYLDDKHNDEPVIYYKVTVQ